MSAFLGKIHYWLYNKIKLHEELLENITDMAQRKGYNSEALLSESYSKFGFPVKGLLENEIDHNNIHGWLQQKIISAESRFAYVVTELLNNNVVKKEEIADIFYKNGAEIMNRLDIKEGSPQDLFKLISDYMLEGMPCDRVNEIIESDDKMITWKTITDIHKEYWDCVSGDVSNFNYFKDFWIEGFLSAGSKEYKHSRTDNGINTIMEV